MRETLRHLASTGKTVFVSSHILGEVRQLADVVGIIAAGRLVREAAMDALLRDAGQVRVRVPADQAAAAQSALSGFGQTPLGEPDDGHAWLSVPVGRDAAADVTRALANAGIYLSGMETEGNLEALFLELTGGQLDTDMRPAQDSQPNGGAA